MNPERSSLCVLCFVENVWETSPASGYRKRTCDEIHSRLLPMTNVTRQNQYDSQICAHISICNYCKKGYEITSILLRSLHCFYRNDEKIEIWWLRQQITFIGREEEAKLRQFLLYSVYSVEWKGMKHQCPLILIEFHLTSTSRNNEFQSHLFMKYNEVNDLRGWSC